MIESIDLIQQFGLHTAHLSRWRKRRWLHYQQEKPGTGYKVMYPDWTPRMVSVILRTELGDNAHVERNSRILQITADTLSANPETEWVVISTHLGIGLSSPCAADAVEQALLFGSMEPMPAIVCVPYEYS